MWNWGWAQPCQGFSSWLDSVLCLLHTWSGTCSSEQVKTCELRLLVSPGLHSEPLQLAARGFKGHPSWADWKNRSLWPSEIGCPVQGKLQHLRAVSQTPLNFSALPCALRQPWLSLTVLLLGQTLDRHLGGTVVKWPPTRPNSWESCPERGHGKARPSSGVWPCPTACSCGSRQVSRLSPQPRSSSFQD